MRNTIQARRIKANQFRVAVESRRINPSNLKNNREGTPLRQLGRNSMNPTVVATPGTERAVR
jgi:hypothetical protein